RVRPHRNQARLRARRVRRVHGADRRCTGVLVSDAGSRESGPRDHDGGRTRHRKRAASAPDRVRRGGRRAVRLLHAGDPPRGESVARPQSATRSSPDGRGHQRQPLPLHRLHRDLRGDRSRRGRGQVEMSDLSVIGRRLPKVNVWEHLTGTAKYADDIALPRLLFGKLLRSTEPHARIVGVDLSRALAHPGVVAGCTGADMPQKMGITPWTQDETALAVDKVRYVGEPVAAIAALDEDTAFEALSLIDVEYEQLEPILTLDDALTRGDVRIHEDSPNRANIFKEVHLEFGDLEGGFARADHVRDDWFFFEGNTHAPIEQHSAVANFEPDGKLTLWTSTQVPHYLHRELEKVLGLPRSHIRVIATPNYPGALLTVTYKIPAYKFDATRVYTNRPPCGPKRGHGSTQPRYGFECQMDKLAADLGIDPLELRLRNLQPPHSKTINELRVTSMGLGEALERAATATGYRDRPKVVGRGLGIAGSAYISGAGLPIYWNDMPHSGAIVTLDRGGGVLVSCGTSEIGQGSDMMLASVAAEELGVLPEAVHVGSGDSALSPVDLW